MIHACNIHFAYHRRQVLEDTTLALAPGELVCLLGANGVGKSTLLKIMQGLLKPQRGCVTLDGRPLSGMRRRQLARAIAYVPQVHAAPFPYTVREVALMGRLAANGVFRAPDAKDRALVENALEHLSIAHLAARPYTEISGGERQLALIARALVQEARFLVMDEPFAGLDYGHQMRLLARLQDLAAEGYGVLIRKYSPCFVHGDWIVGSQRSASGDKVSDDGARWSLPHVISIWFECKPPQSKSLTLEICTKNGFHLFRQYLFLCIVGIFNSSKHFKNLTIFFGGRDQRLHVFWET